MEAKMRKRRDNALYRLRKKGCRADTKGRTVYMAEHRDYGRWRGIRQIRTLVEVYGFSVQLEFAMFV